MPCNELHARTMDIYTIQTVFKRLFSDHHELRYTFNASKKECGINPELVILWDGHSFDKDVKTSVIDRGYTDYSEEYLYNEAQKIDYKL